MKQSSNRIHDQDRASSPPSRGPALVARIRADGGPALTNRTKAEITGHQNEPIQRPRDGSRCSRGRPGLCVFEQRQQRRQRRRLSVQRPVVPHVGACGCRRERFLQQLSERLLRQLVRHGRLQRLLQLLLPLPAERFGLCDGVPVQDHAGVLVVRVGRRQVHRRVRELVQPGLVEQQRGERIEQRVRRRTVRVLLRLARSRLRREHLRHAGRRLDLRDDLHPDGRDAR